MFNKNKSLKVKDSEYNPIREELEYEMDRKINISLSNNCGQQITLTYQVI